jgi:hypothetical protein
MGYYDKKSALEASANFGLSREAYI